VPEKGTACWDSLRRSDNTGTIEDVADAPITHEDATTIMVVISDIRMDVERIRFVVEGGEDGEEEDETPEGDS
jgi:hypothetical protein